MMRFRVREANWGKYSECRRSGFTLIEVLITMVIVLFLSGMLLGAVVLVQRSVGRARQTAEIQQLDIALNKFKEYFGVFPPSRIRLVEWDALSNPTNPVGRVYDLADPFDAHSVSYLKRIWPDFKLPINQSGQAVERPDPGTQIRWFVDNATGAAWDPQTTVYELEGDECLVFFLGGVAERIGQEQYVLHGFTEDPRNPSRIMNITLDPRSQTRDSRFPLYNFDPSRLYQRAGADQIAGPGTAENTLAGVADFFAANNNNPRPPIKLPSYRAMTSDRSQPKPVVYFSSYEGRGYRPDDCNLPPSFGAPVAEQTIRFQLRWPLITQVSPPNGNLGGIPESPQSLGPNPYTQAPLSTAVKSVGGQDSLVTVPVYNPQTFQIIVPGADNEFGGGGHQQDYDLTNGERWELNNDNMTNFSGGQELNDFLTTQNPGN